MISFAFPRVRRDPSIAALYGVIVAQARRPVFYRDFGVPDTVSARIDMILLHLVLVLRRLRRMPQTGEKVGQDLFDHFCRDIDDNFREMGVGDLKVPKEMQRVAGAFYGRARAYDAALDQGDCDALASALSRNVFDAPQPPLGAARLAAYMEQAVGTLGQQDDTALLKAELVFPVPSSTAAD
jgi:cytochrome b pre-mRNA-processing protein 3